MAIAFTPPALPTTAWVTLVTRASYLPGAILLAHSLTQHQSAYPLIILTTPSFPSSHLAALQRECALSNAIHHEIPSLSPPPGQTPETLIASRFQDTWTKLRVFSLHQHGCESLVFLDADMLIRRNMDELFAKRLPGHDWIAANHCCVCGSNADWAPADWTEENCAFTGLNSASPPPLVPAQGGKETHSLLNSGLVLFHPHEAQWQAILDFLAHSPLVRTFLFPDQDFLAEFFRGRWLPIGWSYNALKTWRYFHSEFWNDDEVRNLHYIVDKPWNARVGRDGVAGYEGRDGVTHAWWWEEYEKWRELRERMGEVEVLETMDRETAAPLQEVALGAKI